MHPVARNPSRGKIKHNLISELIIVNPFNINGLGLYNFGRLSIPIKGGEEKKTPQSRRLWGLWGPIKPELGGQGDGGNFLTYKEPSMFSPTGVMVFNKAREDDACSTT